MMPLILAALLAGLLAGCSVIPKSEPVRLFTLPAPTLPASNETIRELTLRVDTPGASAPLDGRRLLIMPTPGEFQAYGGARWRDDAPRLLRDHLIEALRRDGRLAAVIDDTGRARSEAALTSHLGAFHVRYREGTPEVVVRLDVQLLDDRSREVRASRRVEAVVTSNDESLDAVVAAFGRAADQLAVEVVDWTLSTLD
ncbi:ABC-type transport auxiliary lipoprotein family protein [Halomonas saccharevitans]|uniref:ABC-type transport auxiliary lipoprotein family protein n=1 Tax=Halomonas saccharevitans TaxID=416872 RepID=A0ABU3NC69_9GAMM|nr:ABC-type transport auxiliary lipoprotein family protein [Halomonas saccharevitans]MDT8878727.1 ABC-type transport auxiliary lipoprotein family protein [Halomonas saccharevitans]